MRKSNARFNTLVAAKANASTTKVTNWKGAYVDPNFIMCERKGSRVAYCLRHVTSMQPYVDECRMRGVDATVAVTL